MNEPVLPADYVVVRHRLEEGELVALPAGFVVLSVKVDVGVGDLLVWTLEPIS